MVVYSHCRKEVNSLEHHHESFIITCQELMIGCPHFGKCSADSWGGVLMDRCWYRRGCRCDWLCRLCCSSSKGKDSPTRRRRCIAEANEVVLRKPTHPGNKNYFFAKRARAIAPEQLARTERPTAKNPACYHNGLRNHNKRDTPGPRWGAWSGSGLLSDPKSTAFHFEDVPAIWSFCVGLQILGTGGGVRAGTVALFGKGACGQSI